MDAYSYPSDKTRTHPYWCLLSPPLTSNASGLGYKGLLLKVKEDLEFRAEGATGYGDFGLQDEVRGLRVWVFRLGDGETSGFRGGV